MLKIVFPEELPVSRRRDDIRAAMEAHQVVIVCGDTGSGKTTQLPKIALEMGRGREGRRIGCTQPRRIAATSVARRVAEELQVVPGEEVGYQIRFEDRTNRLTTAVKFMTDGVLLAETRHDPRLCQYDTLIIDEAHERSLNIDFILGYLHRILSRRRDLKVVISSATLDAGSFSRFFDGAPVVEVEGRMYPVEDRYQVPLHEREPLAEQVARAAEDLGKEDRFGDTLVFLPGEREIREVADLLEGRKYPETLVLPLFARQGGKEQQAVFRPMRSKRRIILATNVAETSLTIPGIRFVIDSGIARVSRHDPGSGIQRLQVEGISKASARQRRGRCGRVSEGVCVRLYSEEEFEDREEYTDPEILRSNLSGVVLQMEALGLGDPLKFPFVDPPQPKRIAQAYRVLEEIGAIRKTGKRVELTETGRILARLPLDPRIGRILVGAREENCLQEGLVVASALTVQDPRERPRERQEAADEAHRKFRDKRSDYTSWLRWWHAIEEARGKSNNHLRRFCVKHFANYRRVQEWINLHRELRNTLRELKWKIPPAKAALANPEDTYSEPLHRAVLAAIPSQIGMNKGKKQGYQGAGNSTFFLFPGSGVSGNAPAWVMAFEMVETARLYARNLAVLDPGWVEKVAPHLCRYRYSNPHWVKEQGAVYGEERVTAFGLPVVEKRRVHYGRIDEGVARRIFLLEALVNQNTRAPLPSLRKNRETLAAAEKLEHKMRRLGGLIHPEAVAAFYEERVPRRIFTQKDFEKWVHSEREATIDFTLDDCLIPQREPIRPEDYPDEILSPDGSSTFALRYRYAPGEPDDGITVEVPLAELLPLPEWFGDWLVPGWLPEKAGALLRCLRKETRTLLPANREIVEEFLESWDGYEPACGLIEALLDHLSSACGVDLTPESFDLQRLPAYLRMRFSVVDDGGAEIRAGHDLEELQGSLGGQVRERFAVVARGRFERSHLKSWSFGDLPETVDLDRHTPAYPRLCDDGSGLPALRLRAASECAAVHHRMGLAKLYEVTRPEKMSRLIDVLFSGSGPVSFAAGSGAGPAKPKPQTSGKSQKSGDFGSLASAFGSVAALGKPSPPPRAEVSSPRAAAAGTDGLVARFLTRDEAWLLGRMGPAPERNHDDLQRLICSEDLGLALTHAQWEESATRLDERLFEVAVAICGRVSRLLDIAERVGGLLAEDEAGYEESLADAREHFARLLAPGWLLAGDLPDRLLHFRGLELRLTRMKGAAPAKDLRKLEQYEAAAEEVWREVEPCPCGECPEALSRAATLAADFALRLRIFAPEIRAQMKGSAKGIPGRAAS